jgi:DNA-binding response OmpR family regulator
MEKHKYKILIVDDEPLFVMALRQRLEAEGYEAVEAHGVLSALALVAEESMDLIILDIGLPVGNGIQLLQKFKSVELTRHLPVIVLTAMPTGVWREEALKHGAVELFQKPANNAELLKTIRAALAGQGKE